MVSLRSLACSVHILLGFSTAAWAGDVQNYISGFEDGSADGGGAGWYPTAFTRDIVPVYI